VGATGTESSSSSKLRSRVNVGRRERERDAEGAMRGSRRQRAGDEGGEMEMMLGGGRGLVLGCCSRRLDGWRLLFCARRSDVY